MKTSLQNPLFLDLNRAFKTIAVITFSVVMSACQSTPEAAPANPSPVTPAIAPGSIKLTVQINECTEQLAKSETVFDCSVSVISVQEYGAGTPQLPASTEIEIRIRASLLSSGAEVELEQEAELALLIADDRNTNPNNTNPRWNMVRML